MNTPLHLDDLLKLARFGAQVASYMMITLLAGFLILAWMTMALTFRWGVYLADLFQTRSTLKMKGKL